MRPSNKYTHRIYIVHVLEDGKAKKNLKRNVWLVQACQACLFAHLIYMCKSEESLLRSTALLNHTTDINLSAWILQKTMLLLHTYTQTFTTRRRRDLGLKSHPKDRISGGWSRDPWIGSLACYPLHYRRSSPALKVTQHHRFTPLTERNN